MFKDIKKAIDHVENQKRFANGRNLMKIKTFLTDILNVDFDFFTIKIHVSGTNGKGSTCNYIKEILNQAGLNCGVFSSPYIKVFNERIKINNKLIKNKDLLHYINLVIEKQKLYDYKFTFFELITIISFKYFFDKKVNIIIYEVGIGGLHDCTNIINYDYSVITSIGFDHQKQLGNNLDEILLNKLGIIKEKSNKLYIPTLGEVLDKVVLDYLSKYNLVPNTFKKSDIKNVFFDNQKTSFEYLNKKYYLKMLGKHQISNAVLALSVCKDVLKNTYKIDDKRIYEISYNGLLNAKLIGRLEKVKHNIYIDAAHNISAFNVLKDDIAELFKDKIIVTIYAALADKKPQSCLDIIKSFSSDVFITTFNDPRIYDATKLILENHDIYFCNNVAQGINHIKKVYKGNLNNVVILITGSIHFLSQAIKQI